MMDGYTHIELVAGALLVGFHPRSQVQLPLRSGEQVVSNSWDSRLYWSALTMDDNPLTSGFTIH